MKPWKRTFEYVTNFLQSQETTDFTRLAVAAHTAQPSMKEHRSDGILKCAAPLVVVPWGEIRQLMASST